MNLISIASFVLEVLKTIASLIQSVKTWWTFKLPSYKVLRSLANNNEDLVIFVRDFFIQPSSPLLSQEGLNGPIGQVPNVFELWPRVEGIGLSNILSTLGKLEKIDSIQIMEMSKDPGIWDKNMIIIGAQTQKCFDFYQKMQEVAFRVTRSDIIRNSSGKKIIRDPKYGYGVVLKCKNPYVAGNKGLGFLVGGYGTLGTEAATYYFSRHLDELGRSFGNRSFGVVVRASITAGASSVERIAKYDKVFNH